MISKLNDALAFVRDMLVYRDKGESDLRSALLSVYVTLSRALDEAEAEHKPEETRFCVAIPAQSRWNNFDNKYEQAPAVDLYFIDGFITTSKIMAIKQLRTLDHSSLKEAKDLADRLQANPRMTQG